MCYKREIVILETLEGTAHSDKQLKEVWEARIKANFPHYKILSANVIQKVSSHSSHH